MSKAFYSTILGILAVLVFSTTSFANEQNVVTETPLLQFPVMSDVHIGGHGEYRFQNALDWYKREVPDYKAIAIVGDLTQSGKSAEYDEFIKILKDDKFSNAAEKIITMGNHEYFEGVWGPKPGLTDQFYIYRFAEKIGPIVNEVLTTPYYDKWIEGYHFIILGGEESRITNPKNEDDAIISDKQYNWLKEKLKESNNPNKPIFVFLHQAIDGTVYGSEEWGGGELRKLKEILSQYPQVILFSGHSHNIVNHPRTVYQDKFTMVNAGSTDYAWVDAGYAPGLSQGLLVNVYEDKVEIKARDFTKNTEVNSFTIKVPFEKSIGEQNKPYFNNSKVTVENVTDMQVTLSWDRALDDTLVDRYYISNNKEIIKTEYIEFWNPSKIQNKVYTTINELAGGTNYTFTINAIDAWKNASTPLSVTLRTNDHNGWVKQNNTWYYYTANKKMTGWLWDRGYWYYLDADGAMQTNWIYDGSNWFYLDYSGAMRTGWVEVDNKWYYLAGDGSMQTGWNYLSGTWYYLAPNGVMQTGLVKVGGTLYYLNDSGAMQTGWVETNKKWYFFTDNGAAQTGWKYSWGTWYYLAKDGIMQTGWVYDGSNWYYLSDSGAMKTGWAKDKNQWYYLNSSGAMQSGWIKVSGYWYYMKNSGAMQTGWLQYGSDWYYLDSSGAMQTGWIYDVYKWYYLDNNGVWRY